VVTYSLTLNDTLDSLTAYHKVNINDYPNCQTGSVHATTFAGKPAYNIVWQATVPEQLGTASSSAQNMTIKVMQTYLINNNTGYVVTYKATPSDYNTYLAQAQRIMNSFALT
jgi:hypothetical protein